MKRWLIVLAISFLTVSAAQAQSIDPLDALNKTFREAHTRARTVVLDRSGPILIVDFDTLILLHKKARTEAGVVPPLYHRLKSIAHAPLGIYLTLARVSKDPIAEESLKDLRRLREAMQTADKALAPTIFPAELLDRQRKLLAGCADFLDRTLAAKKATSEELIAFAREMRPLVLANAADAAKLQIDGYDANLAEWRGKLTADEWRQLRVVVLGSALPRRGNLAVQYFAKVLGEAGEGKRVLYAEALFDEDKALRLLAATEVDADMGRAFFDDPTRLHRDLLEDAARQYLKEQGNKLKALAMDQK
jgi:hypothetical protein